MLVVPGVVILLDEAEVLLPFPLERALSPLRVRREVALRRGREGAASIPFLNPPRRTARPVYRLAAVQDGPIRGSTGPARFPPRTRVSSPGGDSRNAAPRNRRARSCGVELVSVSQRAALFPQARGGGDVGAKRAQGRDAAILVQSLRSL